MDEDRDDRDRDDRVYGQDSPSEVGGEDHAPPAATHEGLPRDETSHEPLGPLTPDPGRPLGDTAEAQLGLT